MMAKFEELAAQYLRLALRGLDNGDQIPQSESRAQLESTLELFLPLMLRDADANHWRLEAFDAFRFPVARKTGPFEAELRGVGLLLSDETWTPVQVRLRAAGAGDTIAWGTCQVGDRLVSRMDRLRSGSPDLPKLLATVCEHPENIDWAFSAEYPGPRATPASPEHAGK
jgi:hypothetical protein